jgi:hypothetical protein
MLKKIQLTASLFTLSIGIGLAAKTVIPEVQATPDNTSGGLAVTFLCKVIDEVPNTIARTSVKNLSLGQISSSFSDESVIQWTRPYYSESNETPMERCTRVSELLQYYGNKKILKYITYGIMDAKKVLCATTSTGSPCSLLIFVLEEDENPKQLVTDLLQIIRDPQLLSSSRNSISSSTSISSRWRTPIRSLVVPKSNRMGGIVR